MFGPILLPVDKLHQLDTTGDSSWLISALKFHFFANIRSSLFLIINKNIDCVDTTKLDSLQLHFFISKQRRHLPALYLFGYVCNCGKLGKIMKEMKLSKYLETQTIEKTFHPLVMISCLIYQETSVQDCRENLWEGGRRLSYAAIKAALKISDH